MNIIVGVLALSALLFGIISLCVGLVDNRPAGFVRETLIITISATVLYILEKI